jgi:hypothetical protein
MDGLPWFSAALAPGDPPSIHRGRTLLPDVDTAGRRRPSNDSPDRVLAGTWGWAGRVVRVGAPAYAENVRTAMP